MYHFGAIVLFIVATAFGDSVVVRSGVIIRSTLLRFPLAFLFGHMITASVTFLVAWLLSYFVRSPLGAVLIMVLIAESLFMHYVGYLISLYRKITGCWSLTREVCFDIVSILISFVISYQLFVVHLGMVGSRIVRSPIYWDLQMHIGRIMSFAVGQNIPPEDPHFAGAPLLYHFFYHFLEALYVVAGLNVVGAINFVSITSFAALLIVLLGFGKRFLESVWVGVFAVYFTLIVSSLRFVRDIVCCNRSFLELLSYWFVEEHHPYKHSLLLNYFEYNGGMFNIFYFIVERRLIFGVLFMLCVSTVVLLRSSLSRKSLVFCGVLSSLGFFWHFHILTILATAVIAVSLLGGRVKRDYWFLLPFLVVFIAEILLVKHVTLVEHVYDQAIHSFPKFDFGFGAKGASSPFTWQILWYYGINYGLKLGFIFFGYVLIWSKHRRIFPLMLFLGSGFVFTNVVHLSPGPIYENHKWLRASNVIFDLVAAFGFYSFLKISLWFSLRRIQSRLLCSAICTVLFFPLVVVLSLSGWTELLPFLRSDPDVTHADYNSPLVRYIQSNIKANAVFLTASWQEVHLAGRRVYFAGRVSPALGLNQAVRRKNLKELASYEELPQACLFLKREGIDYVDISGKSSWKWITKTNDLKAVVKLERNVWLFDVHAGCASPLAPATYHNDA